MKTVAPRSTLRKIIKKHKPQLRLAANADLLVHLNFLLFLHRLAEEARTNAFENKSKIIKPEHAISAAKAQQDIIKAKNIVCCEKTWTPKKLLLGNKQGVSYAQKTDGEDKVYFHLIVTRWTHISPLGFHSVYLNQTVILLSLSSIQQADNVDTKAVQAGEAPDGTPKLPSLKISEKAAPYPMQEKRQQYFWRNIARFTNVSQLLEEACGGREADPFKTSVAFVLYLQIRHK
ncbi:hypothetical protein IHE44_0009420 [Lamprotornis superbus]|uniref:Centromere protein W n=1 Tax=Lamprotornis superbus TaxID=245042 RepID=A0A835P4F3_9PASS|nr:hypothetical protein IHE44_0009420 [Lamprotornis superbus]